jgi:hypothetical protein
MFCRCLLLTHCLDDGGSKHFFTGGVLREVHKVQEPRRKLSLNSPPFEPEILLSDSMPIPHHVVVTVTQNTRNVEDVYLNRCDSTVFTQYVRVFTRW